MLTLQETLVQRQKDLQKKQLENEILNTRINANIVTLLNKVDSLQIGQEALQFVEDVANARRGTMKEKIEGIVTEALKIIYGNDYAVELTYSVKNNRSYLEIELNKQTDLGEVKRTIDGFGGGVADTISVPLRLLVLLSHSKASRTCILDEAYKHVDLEKIEHVAQFLKDISEKLGMQLILCSHHETMSKKADRIYELGDDGGTARVERIK